MSNPSCAALVFGGSRGIGAAIVRRLAEDGYQVAFTYVSRPEKAEELAAAIVDNGGAAMAIRADSAQPTAIRAAVAAATQAYGLLDVAVVNAGVLRLARLAELSIEDLDIMLDVNLRGVVLAVQSAASAMRDCGRIVTIGSNGAIRTGTPIGAVYAATKAAVGAFVRGAGLDLAPRGITVNNIQPGPTETDMTADMLSQLREAIPLKRLTQPREVASLVSWLVGADALSMTGASTTLDGGFVL